MRTLDEQFNEAITHLLARLPDDIALYSRDDYELLDILRKLVKSREQFLSSLRETLSYVYKIKS